MIEEKNGSEMLTDAEAELYDRQIRLWGLDSQKRLRSAKILFIGLNGFTAEVAKNIILAGVKEVKFLDHKTVNRNDFCSQFFIDSTDIGKNRATASVQKAHALNAMVNLTADESNIDDKPDIFFREFHIVCASECTITQLKKINDCCRRYNVKFFAGDVWGQFGFNFADLMTHEYVMEITMNRKKISGGGIPDQSAFESIVSHVKQMESFVPFERILHLTKLPKRSEDYYLFQIMMNYREKYGRDPQPGELDSENFRKEAKFIIEKYDLGETIDYVFEYDLYAQVSPVCAILGGIMGQEIIKTVSQKEPPNNNFFVFNSTTMCGKILRLGY